MKFLQYYVLLFLFIWADVEDLTRFVVRVLIVGICIIFISLLLHSKLLVQKQTLSYTPPQSKYSPLSLSGVIFQRSTTSKDTTTSPSTPTTNQKTGYLCPKLSGGLGNLMFEYASVYGISRFTGRRLYMDHSGLEAVFQHLNVTVDKELCNPKRLKELKSKTHCSFDPTMLQIPSNDNYLVKDYLQSFKYFEKYQSEIRQQFTFKPELKNKAREDLRDIAVKYTSSLNHTLPSSSVTFIGVHIRRGDMLKESHFKKYGYQIPNADYIRKAMDYMKTIYSNIAFVFATNDMKWVKSKFQGNDIFFPKLLDANSQFAILSSCNHSITSIGTYGWWSAYLAGGTTLYYKFPAREGSDLRKQFSSDYKDFFMRGWIGLD